MQRIYSKMYGINKKNQMIRLKCLSQSMIMNSMKIISKILICDINSKEKLEKAGHIFFHKKGERNI